MQAIYFLTSYCQYFISEVNNVIPHRPIAVMVKAQVNTVSDKVRNRLEQLDDFEEVRIKL